MIIAMSTGNIIMDITEIKILDIDINEFLGMGAIEFF